VRGLTLAWLWFALGLFLLRVLARYGVTSWLIGWSWWFRGTLPILFHWVLASYLLALALHGSRPGVRSG
jgi:hypothetical protein